MNIMNIRQTEEREPVVDKKLLQLISDLLCNPHLPEEIKIDPHLAADPDFQKIYTYIFALRDLSAALRSGDLQLFVGGKGFVLANLKALQSNLRHLTWQAKKVAEGDFSQRVEFLGEFSEAFNEMIDNLRDNSIQLHKLASLDGLTQLYNRTSVDDFLADTFEKARSNDAPLSVLLFDIDHFKAVNDNYGHSVGDQVLIKVSDVLKKQFRSTDMLARYGGEEFIAVLPDTKVEVAKNVGNRALEALRETVIDIEDGRSIRITVSAGVSNRMPEDVSYEDIVKRSDVALYTAKNSGRDCLCAE